MIDVALRPFRRVASWWRKAGTIERGLMICMVLWMCLLTINLMGGFVVRIQLQMGGPQ